MTWSVKKLADFRGKATKLCPSGPESNLKSNNDQPLWWDTAIVTQTGGVCEAEAVAFRTAAAADTCGEMSIEEIKPSIRGGRHGSRRQVAGLVCVYV